MEPVGGLLAQVFVSSSLIPLNLEIKTRSPLTPPKHLTLEMATVHVRHETRRGVDFEDELKKATQFKSDGGKFSIYQSQGMPSRSYRQDCSIKSLRFYALLQAELIHPGNRNQVEREAPKRLSPTPTTNVHGRPRDAEHARHGEGSRHLAKTAAETAAP